MLPTSRFGSSDLLKIIVTFAVEAEFATWRRMSHFEPAPGAGIRTYVMRTPEAEIHAVITGIGVRSLRSELQDDSSTSPRADLCIASGLAGSLRKDTWRRSDSCREGSQVDVAQPRQMPERCIACQKAAGVRRYGRGLFFYFECSR